MLDTKPAFRDRMQTLPHDLSEYARVQTGPGSWSAHPDAEALAAWALDAHVDPCFSRMTDLLADIAPTDIPQVVPTAAELASLVGHREAFVIASIDGESTLDMMLDTIDLPSGELLAIVCSLCARGLIVLDRSQRPRSAVERGSNRG